MPPKKDTPGKKKAGKPTAKPRKRASRVQPGQTPPPAKNRAAKPHKAPVTGKPAAPVPAPTPPRKPRSRAATGLKAACQNGSPTPTPEPARQPTRASEKRYYVLAVEPNTDGRVKKDLKRRRAIESVEKLIGRVIIPYKTKEVILTGAGKVLAESTTKEAEAVDARRVATRKAWELEGYPDYDDPRPPEGMRVQVFPAPAATKGKVGNGWVWKVREERGKEERRVVVREKKFPGYLIINMVWTEKTHHLVTGLRGAVGFLPIPLPLPSNPTPAQVAEAELWHPTALETEEAAELLIQQSLAAKEKQKQKVPVLPYKIGDRVRIKEGAFAKLAGTVREINPPANDPAVVVVVELFGVEVSVTLKHWHCEEVVDAH